MSQRNSSRSLKLVLNDSPTSIASYFGIARIVSPGMSQNRAFPKDGASGNFSALSHGSLAIYSKADFSGGWFDSNWSNAKLVRGRRGWALPYTDRMVSHESGKASDSGVATRQRASAPTYRKSDFSGTRLGVMKDSVFIVVQVVFWSLVVAGWVSVRRADAKPLLGRQWLSRGSLGCASLALLFTTAMTIYVRVGQRRPYDIWESRYLLVTTIVSLLGIVLASFGKATPRLIGLLTSIFTLLIALADAAAL